LASYVERNLLPGETIDHRSRVSWVAALGTGMVEMIVAFAVFVAGQMSKLQEMTLRDAVASINPKKPPQLPAQHPGWWSISIGEVVAWVALAVLVFALASLIRGWIFRMTAEYAVTDQRVIGKYGLVSQESIDVRISAITGVTTSNTLPGRIFGYGTVWVNAAGTRDQLVAMTHPKAFESAVYNRLSKATAASPSDAYGAPMPQFQAAPGTAPHSAACSHCGSAAGLGARFCSGCGNPIG
jgi:uncharacterized membrane protein YdbT with pleckstrin-like domain